MRCVLWCVLVCVSVSVWMERRVLIHSRCQLQHWAPFHRSGHVWPIALPFDVTLGSWGRENRNLEHQGDSLCEEEEEEPRPVTLLFSLKTNSWGEAQHPSLYKFSAHPIHNFPVSVRFFCTCLQGISLGCLKKELEARKHPSWIRWNWRPWAPPARPNKMEIMDSPCWTKWI